MDIVAFKDPFIVRNPLKPHYTDTMKDEIIIMFHMPSDDSVDLPELGESRHTPTFTPRHSSEFDSLEILQNV